MNHIDIEHEMMTTARSISIIITGGTETVDLVLAVLIQDESRQLRGADVQVDGMSPIDSGIETQKREMTVLAPVVEPVLVVPIQDEGGRLRGEDVQIDGMITKNEMIVIRPVVDLILAIPIQDKSGHPREIDCTMKTDGTTPTDAAA